MRRGRKNKIRRERMIMIASSALVMGALTLTGVYMKNTMTEKEDDGYAVDFSALEDSVDDKVQEIEEARLQAKIAELTEGEQLPGQLADASGISVNEDALDYAPVEVDSGLVEIPGLTDKLAEESVQLEAEASVLLEKVKSGDDDEEDDDEDDRDDDPQKEQSAGVRKEEVTGAVSQSKEVMPEFSEAEGLLRPVSGEVILPYSMESSIYFSTLDQYKYHPAVVLQAQEGEAVAACADGRVIAVYEDAQIGQAIKLELGNGYQAVYGQLKDLTVTEGSTVTAGSVLGSVAAPTKYFTLEGANLYFALTLDGEPVNPEQLFR